jgi:hypothetical protein
MKAWLISVLQGWITALDPGIVFPVERMNYKKSVNAILKQTQSGRNSFYAILLSYISTEDKATLLKLLKHETRKSITNNRRADSTIRLSSKT